MPANRGTGRRDGRCVADGVRGAGDSTDDGALRGTRHSSLIPDRDELRNSVNSSNRRRADWAQSCVYRARHGARRGRRTVQHDHDSGEYSTHALMRAEAGGGGCYCTVLSIERVKPR